MKIQLQEATEEDLEINQRALFKQTNICVHTSTNCVLTVFHSGT